MAARPTITDVSMTNFGIPLAGQVNATPIIRTDGSAGYAWSTGASGDAITIGADYGVYSTTHSSNVAIEMTTLKDPQ